MKNLIKYKEELFNLEFPDSQIEDDDFYDCYVDFVEIDAYYAGIVQSFVDGVSTNKINFKYFEEIKDVFDCIKYEKLSKNDKKIYNDFKSYLKVLEKLLISLKKLIV